MIRSVIIAALFTCAPAWGAEYRSITLANGRVVPAEIQGITATAMTLSTPQGIMEVSPSDLKGMDSMSAEEYAAVKPWNVLVLPFSTDESPGTKDDASTAQLYALRVLKSIPAVAPFTIDMLPPSVPENTQRALSLCKTDLQCATRNGEAVGADLVIMGDLREHNAEKNFSVGAVFVHTPSARARKTMIYEAPLLSNRQAITAALYDVLFLQQPSGQVVLEPPPITKAPPQGDEKTESAKPTDLAQLAWTPVPGITALKSGNTAGFATALGAVGAGTAASVYIAGHATYSGPQLVAISTLSTYGLTVLVNHMFLQP